MDEDVELAKQRLGTLVGGKWTLEQVLGAGGLGAVYRARGPAGEFAAVKVLHAALAHKTDVKQRFVREGTLANKVLHEGALKVLEHGFTSEGAGYLVMELLEGETLSQLVRQDGAIGVKQLFHYLDQVLSVLIVAHGTGIIHRDLKPDNLFITTKGKLKVLDFGLARHLSDIQGDFKTRTGLALGTLPYMAPEQALGRRAQVDARVDLFALGAMAFRLLSRRKIHEADSEAELLMKMATLPAPALGEFAPNVPKGAQQVVDMALAFSKEARYPDARTMQQDVRDVLAERVPSHAAAQLAHLDVATRVQPASPASDSPRGIATTRPLEAYPQRTATMPISQRVPATLHEAGAPAAPPRIAPFPASSQAAQTRRPSRLWLVVATTLSLLAAAGGTALLIERSSVPPPPPPPLGAARAKPAPPTPAPAPSLVLETLPADEHDRANTTEARDTAPRPQAAVVRAAAETASDAPAPAASAEAAQPGQPQLAAPAPHASASASSARSGRADVSAPRKAVQRRAPRLSRPNEQP